MHTIPATIERILTKADIRIQGDRPWDLQIHDPRVFGRVMTQGTRGFGEAYMDGWWNCEQLDELICRIFRSGAKQDMTITPTVIFSFIQAYLMNLASAKRAFQIGEAHYDIGNDLYQRMLDNRMTYTCAYWKDAQNLDDAQEAKLDLVCRKIGLKKGDRVLDIGCGWGSFAGYAYERYGAQVVGITVSQKQLDLAKARYSQLPVEFRLQDYRDLDEPFDHIVSLGMFEHVGVKNFKIYFEMVRRCLKDGGLFLLHTIGGNKSVRGSDPWIAKYIFPNSMLPSIQQIARATERKFVMEDWHNFGTDYDKTLMAWYHNIESQWEHLSDRYDERFRRMWRYYLLSCAGFFRAREGQLWQIVFSKHGVPGGYTSIR